MKGYCTILGWIDSASTTASISGPFLKCASSPWGFLMTGSGDVEDREGGFRLRFGTEELVLEHDAAAKLRFWKSELR